MKRTHGLRRGSPLYHTWLGMLRRCENPSHPKFGNYGGRGIRVCEDWHDVTKFVAWINANLGPRPDGMTLDRKDSDGDYEPGNVRWATRTEQAANRRNQRKQSGTISRFKGVYLDRRTGRWNARISIKDQTRCLGTFDDEEDAARAYDAAALAARGALARLNFPDPEPDAPLTADELEALRRIIGPAPKDPDHGGDAIAPA